MVLAGREEGVKEADALLMELKLKAQEMSTGEDRLVCVFAGRLLGCWAAAIKMRWVIAAFFLFLLLLPA